MPSHTSAYVIAGPSRAALLAVPSLTKRVAFIPWLKVATTVAAFNTRVVLGPLTAAVPDPFKRVIPGALLAPIAVMPALTKAVLPSAFKKLGLFGSLIPITPGGGVTSMAWSTPVAVYQNGSAGLNNAQVLIYQRSSSGAPALPSAGVTYTFATGVATGLNNGWTQAVPGGSAPLYVSAAAASANTTTDTIAAIEWAGAVLFAQDGAAGANSATVYLFQRTTTSTPPALPSASITYTFATGAAAGITNGWTQTLPTTGGSYRWITTASALGSSPTDTIPSTEWAAQSLLAQDGTSAATLALTCTAQTFTYDTAGAASPSTQTITFTANLSGGLTGTAAFTCALYDASGTSLGAVTLGGSGNTRTLTNAQFLSLGAAQQAIVVATLSGFTDQTTIVKLRDGAAGSNGTNGSPGSPGTAAVTGLLTNESTTVAADSAGTVASFTGTGGTFMVFDGLTDKTGNASVTYSVSGSPTGGLSISIASTGVYTITALTGARGTATLQAVYGTVTLQKIFDITKSLAGADGVTPDAYDIAFTPSTLSPAAYSNGHVPSFTGVSTTASLKRNGTDETSSWTVAVAASSYATTSVSGAVIGLSALSDNTDALALHVTFTRTGYPTQSRDLIVSKVKSLGAAGGLSPLKGTLSFGYSTSHTGTTEVYGVKIASNGSMSVYVDASGIGALGALSTWPWPAAIDNWYFPNVSGIGSSYSLRFTLAAGSSAAPSGITYGEARSMASDLYISYSIPGGPNTYFILLDVTAIDSAGVQTYLGQMQLYSTIA